MGCSATKSLTVEPLDGTLKSNSQTNGKFVEPRKVSIPLQVPPLEGEDPQTELLESGTVNNIQKGANGLSFEIAFEEESRGGKNDADGGSIIKKHPPKRFQKLEDAPPSPAVTLSRLQEKLEEAEIRRQQILQQRIQSAKVRKTLKKQGSVNSSDEDNQDNNHLKIPPDVPIPLKNPYDVSYL